MLMIKQTVLIIVLIVGGVLSPLPASAEGVESPPVASEPVVISEVQVNGEGTGTTTQEFIELYNWSENPVNMAGWSVVYVNSSGNETALYTFANAYLFLPQTFIVGKNNATKATYLPDIQPDFTYAVGSSGLAASSGTIIVKNEKLDIVDSLAWTSAASFVDEQTVTSLANGKSAQRKCLGDQSIINTGLAYNDFYVGDITPAVITCIDPAVPPGNDPADESTEEDTEVAVPAVTEEPSVPVVERLYLPLLINELFIDPVSPLTDGNDEFTELYNPNDQPVDISGYVIVAGTTTKYRHIFTDGTTIAAHGFITIIASDSSLTLTNSGTTVMLYNDMGESLDTVTYDKVVAGAAWARGANGAWVWTTTPTNNAPNSIIAPIIATTTKTKAVKTATAKKSTSAKNKKTNFSVAAPIQLNEIYPDPKSPETDAQDEFVELYNPHPYTINITDYTIVAGTTKKYTYIFPEGSTIAPGGFVVITSADTNLSLTNSGGEVVLRNNFDKEIDKVSYEAAKQGTAYARDELGRWQWTTTVTKAAENSITTTSSNASGTTNTAGVVAGTDGTPLAPAPQPLPGWVLAALGVSAVCYAAYEYRFETRNYFYKLSANRITR